MPGGAWVAARRQAAFRPQRRHTAPALEVSPHPRRYIVMACVLMAYVGMAYIVMAYIVMGLGRAASPVRGMLDVLDVPRLTY